MKPFNVGDIAIGQNLVDDTHLNNMECTIIGGLDMRGGVFPNGETAPVALKYKVEWANGEITVVTPPYLRRKIDPTNDKWADEKLNNLLDMRNWTVEV